MRGVTNGCRPAFEGLAMRSWRPDRGWGARLLVVSLITLLAPVVASGVAVADATLTMSVSPTTIDAQSSHVSGIRVSSVEGCPPSTADHPYVTVEVALVDAVGQHVLDQQGLQPDARDASWSTVLLGPFSPAIPRNGHYFVVAACLNADPETDGVLAVYEPVRVDVVSPPGGQDPTERFAGDNRIATAIAVSQDVFADAGAGGVVLTRSDSYADALAGTPLAVDLGGPLLLTPGANLDETTAAEIDRVLDGEGTVYVLGGTGAISDGVVGALGQGGYDVVRLAGSDRFATAVEIATEIGSPSTVLLADGNDFRDGLVAGATANEAAIANADPGDGGVVLLTNGTALPSTTRDYLAGHPQVVRFAIGSAAAAADPTATPIAGNNPAATSALVASRFFNRNDGAAIATTAAFPDGLAGGLHAAAFEVPLLLTDPNGLSPEVKGYLQTNAARINIGFAYGGYAALPAPVTEAVSKAMSSTTGQ